MFWALNGATRSPWRVNRRHSAAVSRLFPALEQVPCNIRAGGKPEFLSIFFWNLSIFVSQCPPVALRFKNCRGIYQEGHAAQGPAWAFTLQCFFSSGLVAPGHQ